MTKKFLLYSVWLAVFAMVATTAFAQQDSTKVKGAISAKKFKRLAKKDNTVVIDVRTPEEYKAGHLPNALLMDFKQPDFERRIRELDRSKRYLLHCRSGKRSAGALQLFRQNGFKKVYHLKGGIEAWKDPLQ